MAPMSITLATATTSCSTFFPQTPSQQLSLKPHANQTHRFHVSCNVSSDDHEKPLTTNPNPKKLILPNTSLDLQNVDRRNMLLGLGCLYSTVNLTGLPSAFAAPIMTPSLYPNCKNATSGITLKNGTVRSTACCPPPARRTEEAYVLPTTNETRVRKPIHKLTLAEQEKFKKAIAIMKSLPDDDPRSFTNQAKIHCAYCNGSYTQNGQELQIHNSWLFFPFHRWYLYFYERILGHLIDDETFALPYWNWDDVTEETGKSGMVIPDWIGKGGESNPVYDLNRNEKYLNGAKVDLDFQGKDRVLTSPKYTQVDINLKTMYRQMKRNAFDTSSFFGGNYVAGSLTPTSSSSNVVGSIEAGCHTAIHRWVGSTKNPNFEDMGNFYSAGYDPLFYLHHSNVDRMWSLWKDLDKQHMEPTDADWLDASFVFYDEKQNPVRVNNRDVGNLDKLGYNYEKSETVWNSDDARSKPTPKCTGPVKKAALKMEDVKTPLKIDETVSVQVSRRPYDERKNKKEILFLKGIEFDGEDFVKFDVFVNDCEDIKNYSPCDSENVGSFAAIPHKKGMKMTCESGVRFSLTELLKEIKAEKEDSIRVTIVPRKTGRGVSIKGISIEFLEI